MGERANIHYGLSCPNSAWLLTSPGLAENCAHMWNAGIIHATPDSRTSEAAVFRGILKASINEGAAQAAALHGPDGTELEAAPRNLK